MSVCVRASDVTVSTLHTTAHAVLTQDAEVKKIFFLGPVRRVSGVIEINGMPSLTLGWFEPG